MVSEVFGILWEVAQVFRSDVAVAVDGVRLQDTGAEHLSDCRRLLTLEGELGLLLLPRLIKVEVDDRFAARIPCEAHHSE